MDHTFSTIKFTNTTSRFYGWFHFTSEMSILIKKFVLFSHLECFNLHALIFFFTSKKVSKSFSCETTWFFTICGCAAWNANFIPQTQLFSSCLHLLKACNLIFRTKTILDINKKSWKLIEKFEFYLNHTHHLKAVLSKVNRKTKTTVAVQSFTSLHFFLWLSRSVFSCVLACFRTAS